jgi:hypothetical protein
MTPDAYLADPTDFELIEDDRISLADACRLLPSRNGKPPHLYTVRRWASHGVKGTDGKLVRLRAFRVGRTWYTRRAWISEFIEILTDGMDGTDGVSQPTEPARRQRILEARRRVIVRGVHGTKAKKELLGL